MGRGMSFGPVAAARATQKQPQNRGLCTRLTICQKVEPPSCFSHVGAHAHHAELRKHVGVVRRSQCHRSTGIAGLRGSLKYRARRNHVARCDQLFALSHKKLDRLWVKHTNGRIVGRARLQHDHGFTLG